DDRAVELAAAADVHHGLRRVDDGVDVAAGLDLDVGAAGDEEGQVPGTRAVGARAVAEADVAVHINGGRPVHDHAGVLRHGEAGEAVGPGGEVDDIGAGDGEGPAAEVARGEGGVVVGGDGRRRVNGREGQRRGERRRGAVD